jgi:hypothetical protein
MTDARIAARRQACGHIIESVAVTVDHGLANCPLCEAHKRLDALTAEVAELRAENVNMKSINEHRQKLLAEVFELRAAREASEND